MKPSKQSLYAKQSANACERKANEHADRLEPWSLANARTYQRLMCNALADRSRVLKVYLAKRSQRQPRKG